MDCHPFSGPDGLRGFVCSRGQKRHEPRRFCVVCLRAGTKTPATILCDWPNDAFTSSPAPKTCDAGLCREHAVRVGTGIDHCPGHRTEP